MLERIIKQLSIVDEEDHETLLVTTSLGVIASLYSSDSKCCKIKNEKL